MGYYFVRLGSTNRHEFQVNVDAQELGANGSLSPNCVFVSFLFAVFGSRFAGQEMETFPARLGMETCLAKEAGQNKNCAMTLSVETFYSIHLRG